MAKNLKVLLKAYGGDFKTSAHVCMDVTSLNILLVSVIYIAHVTLILSSDVVILKLSLGDGS